MDMVYAAITALKQPLLLEIAWELHPAMQYQQARAWRQGHFWVCICSGRQDGSTHWCVGATGRCICPDMAAAAAAATPRMELALFCDDTV